MCNLTVGGYFQNVCRDKREKDQLDRLITLIDKKNESNIHIFDKDFRNYISYPLRMYFNLRLKIDFKLPCLVSNHFVLRLIDRFKNESIRLIMEDIVRVLGNSTNYIVFKGNGIIELFSIFYSIVYSNINNILLTIIPYTKGYSSIRYIQQYCKNNRSSKKISNKNKKNRYYMSKYILEF